MTNDDGSPKYPGGYTDYLVNHERKPGIGPLAGWRGENGESAGHGAPNTEQLQRYIDNQCFWRHELAPQERYFKFANKEYLQTSEKIGLIDAASPIVMQLYSEPLQRFRLAGEGKGPVPAPEAHRDRLTRYFDPLPIWYPPQEDEVGDAANYPLHAVTQRPMAMYHSWGSQNAWLRQIHGHNPLYLSEDTAREAGLEDGDWAAVTSRHGRITAPIKIMRGVNGRTIWTWNAVGKRSGAWNLDERAEESERGVLLNHLIDELLPERGSGYRYASSDPVTGQAAWYDLRVRIGRVPRETARSEPRFASLRLPGLPERPALSRYGAKAK
jgi:anaerobic selenocysteine-containing dehydrogenase